MFQHAFRSLHAPEFPDGLSWLNHQPLSLKEMRGKVVLLVFFTETDPLSLSLISQIQHWHEAYAGKGLQVIGVHVPVFDFQKTSPHVAKALKRADITFPVVLDADHKMTRLHTNHWVPRMVLVDQHGAIVADHVGTVGLVQAEQELQELLFSPITPALFCGFVHGRFGNADDLIPNEEQAFTDPVMHHEGLLYLHGHFTITNDSVAHTRRLATPTEFIRIAYRGYGVSMVARGRNHEKAFIEIETDGKKQEMIVSEPRLYPVIEHAYHKGTVTIRTASDALECFSFSFDGCKKPFSALG